MPLLKGKKNVSKNIQEFHQGERYRKLLKLHGKKKADQIAVAAAMNASRQ